MKLFKEGFLKLTGGIPTPSAYENDENNEVKEIYDKITFRYFKVCHE